MKSNILLLLIMFMLHVFADFHLQGIFADLKQKSWWNEQLLNYKPDKKKLYKYDYLVGLFLHSLEWSFIFMIPILLIEENVFCILMAIIINTSIHATIDEMKCNRLAINLIQDQLCHTFQVVATWFVFFYVI